MIRGTTALNTFEVNTDLRDAKVFVTYSQRGRTVAEKTNESLHITENSVEVVLEQIDTLRMAADIPVSIQMRYIREDGVANASNIIKVNVDDVLKGGVIRYE